MTTFYCSLFSTSGMLSYEWKIYITSHYPQGTRSIIKEGTGRFQDVEVWVDRTKQHLLVLIGMLYPCMYSSLWLPAQIHHEIKPASFPLWKERGEATNRQLLLRVGSPWQATRVPVWPHVQEHVWKYKRNSVGSFTTDAKYYRNPQ